MSDQEDDKKNLNDVPEDPGSGNQPKVDEENQPESEKNQNVDTSEGLKENIDVNNDELKNFDTTSDKKEENEGTGHQVIHKKDGRLHIYVRQDKYKGELKSKNWVGRLYIDGKQKISSSGTTNLEEAIPILEKWFDDVQLESERLKKIAE